MRALRALRAGSTGLTTRVFVATAGIVVVVVVAAMLSVSYAARRTADVSAARALEQSADLVAQFLAGRERTLVGGARVFVQGPYFRTLVAERRRDDVLDQASEAAEQIGADWVFITDEDGIMVAKSDEPGVSGVAMGQVPLVAGALRGQVTSGFGASGDSLVFQAVAVPIVAQPGAPVGVLVATRVIDSVFAHDVSAATSSELLFYSRDADGEAHAAAASLPLSDSLSALLSRLSAADAGVSAHDATSAKRSRAADTRAGARIGDIEFLARGTSLSTAGGALVGGFLVLRPRDSGTAAFGGVGAPLLVAVCVGLLIALLATLYAARFVTRPVRELAVAVSEAAEGNLDTPVALSSTAGVRELRALAESFQGLIRDLRDREALVAAARTVERTPDRAASAEDHDMARPMRALSSRARSTPLSVPLPMPLAHPGLVLRPGAMLANRYLIEAEVGRGGLGIVYRALDRTLGETIAIKMLRPELVAADPQAFDRLKAETIITRRLSHRNVVRTYDIGESEDAPFLTMEYVNGASLSTVIHLRGALAPAAVLSIAKQLLRALAVAHEHGIVHGDIKPKNLLVDASGLLKVTDFGVARLVRGARPLPSSPPFSPPSSTSSPSQKPVVQRAPIVSRLTGALVGTPEYMAPEQLIGEPSSARTDIYAAGVVLHECLSGITPYVADTPVAFVARKLGPNDTDASRAASRSTDSEHGGALALLVGRMRDPRAESRPASARDLISELGMLD